MKDIWREFKAEVILAAISLFLIVLNDLQLLDISCIFKFINNDWVGIINDTGINTSDLITFLTIVIGIYLSILCIVATSQSTVIKALIKEETEKQLGVVIIGGIIENMILILYILFSVRFYYQYFILLSLTLISVISFLKFIFILYHFYNISNQETIKNIVQEEKDKNELFTTLTILKDNTKNK